MPSMKYAKLESERRFLLDALPDLPGARVLHITDRYVHGTRLRVRLVEEDGEEPVRKLGQKIPLDDSVPSANAHTTLYLDVHEHLLLSSLPAAVLHKTRYLLHPWAVDVHPSGLVLAETERETESETKSETETETETETEREGEPPFAYVREVTGELAYTGGALAEAPPRAQ